MPDIVLALGSNLGDSARILQGAIDDLAAVDGIQLTAVSPVYETDPVGGPEQPAFLNAVVLGRTRLAAGHLLEVTQGIEQAWHRERQVHWGPRTLDIDVIAYDELAQDDPHLVLPHPRAHERAFVLVPWLDVEPEADLPGHGTVRALLDAIGRDGVRATDVRLTLPTPGGG